MTITLNGTTGITDVNGTAAAPAITGTDTDSGMYFGTNTVGLATNGANAFTADATTDIFYTNGTEKARIDSSGSLLVAATAQYGGEKFNVTQSAAAAGILVRLSSGPYNSSSNSIVIGYDGTTVRFYIPSNGGLFNYSANNVNLSDVRTKTNIQDAGSYLAKICAIPVRTFKYIDQTDDLLNLGCIAQEMEAVAPELVNIDGFGDEVPEDGIPLKGIYQTDLQYALMKCIQEQQALITSLTDRIAALEAR